MDSLEELVPFLLRDTGKTAVAAYAQCVFEAAAQGDREARALLDDAAGTLARKVTAVAKRLRLRPVRVALTGGLFENQPSYRARFWQALRVLLPKVEVLLAETAGALGAGVGRAVDEFPQVQAGNPKTESALPPHPPAKEPSPPALKPIAEAARLAAFSSATTEQRNPRSRGLDQRTIPQLVDLFIREERQVEHALAAQRGAIARAAALVARKLRAGGRLIYVGAGTSGRLGVVDASEMPPTFNAPPEQVQAIMAGGPDAVFKSKEGAEDARDTAVAELRARRLSKNDVVCGIAASGQTPFVLAALEEARRRGAGAILLSCNPNRKIRVPVDVAIDLPTGPELVTGSTRLKAGTATKLVLNMLSTIAMVRLGRVQDNLMINVQATNDKLRARLRAARRRAGEGRAGRGAASARGECLAGSSRAGGAETAVFGCRQIDEMLSPVRLLPRTYLAQMTRCICHASVDFSSREKLNGTCEGLLFSARLSWSCRRCCRRGPTWQSDYLDIYLKMNDAAKLEISGDDRGALAEFEECYTRLHKIHVDHPNWENALVTSRLNDCHTRIVTLETKLAPPPSKTPAEPAPVVAAAVVAAAPESPQARLLALQAAVKATPTVAQAWFNLGTAYFQLNQTDSAIDALQRGLALGADQHLRPQLSRLRFPAQRPDRFGGEGIPESDRAGGDLRRAAL